MAAGYSVRVTAAVRLWAHRRSVHSDPRTGLVDRHGRVATDLRVSLTDRCNLRCVYCLPPEGVPWLPNSEILSDHEVVRLVRVAVERLGITEVRLTGGEPLLRPGLVGIVEGIKSLRPRPKLAITTNGIGLDHLASPLAAAGLDRANVSLDTLNPATFRRIARRDRLVDVLAGIDAAVRAGLSPVKINAVLLRGVNDHQAADLLEFCLHRGLELRFIEQMPLDPLRRWSRAEMITAAEVRELLAERWHLTPDTTDRGSEPAEAWLINGGPDRVGIIASVTQPFCQACDRVRLTADGQIRNCLFTSRESDLRSLMRSGATDAEIAIVWKRAVAGKGAGHGIDDPGFRAPDRPMSAIGG